MPDFSVKKNRNEIKAVPTLKRLTTEIFAPQALSQKVGNEPKALMRALATE